MEIMDSLNEARWIEHNQLFYIWYKLNITVFFCSWSNFIWRILKKNWFSEKKKNKHVWRDDTKTNICLIIILIHSLLFGRFLGLFRIAIFNRWNFQSINIKRTNNKKHILHTYHWPQTLNDHMTNGNKDLSFSLYIRKVVPVWFDTIGQNDSKRGVSKLYSQLIYRKVPAESTKSVWITSILVSSIFNIYKVSSFMQ